MAKKALWYQHCWISTMQAHNLKIHYKWFFSTCEGPINSQGADICSSFCFCPVVSRYCLGSHPITEFTLTVHSTHQQCQLNSKCKQWRGNRKIWSPRIFALLTSECNYIQISMTSSFANLHLNDSETGYYHGTL